MLFVSLALLFAITALRMDNLIILANNATGVINGTNVTNNLMDISHWTVVIGSWIWYLFLAVTVLTLIISAVELLKNKGRSAKKY